MSVLRTNERCVCRLMFGFIASCSAVALASCISSTSHAQELEPRAYSPNPVGINFIVAGATRSSGDVLFNPTLPLENVAARLNVGLVGYGRTFGWLGKLMSAAFVVPFAVGDAHGNVGEDTRSVARSGLADARLRVAINLLGGEALSPNEFAHRKPQTTVGASIVVIAPTGEYDRTKLINIGSNQWAFKPEIGISQPLEDWLFEAYAGVWFFSENDEFYGATRREQQSITAVQAHVSYTFRPQLWLAADVTYYRGGKTSINGVSNANLQENLRMGVTLSVPLTGAQSLKISWSDGARTRIGGDFTTYGLVWQYAWFDG